MKDDKNIFKYITDIRCADTECNLKLETERLIEIFQEAATQFFDLYKLGLASRDESNIAVLVMDTIFKLEEEIVWKDIVTLEVWVSTIDKLYIYVNYDIIVDKRVVGRGKTKFLLYDIKKKKIKRIDDDIIKKVPILAKKGYNPVMDKMNIKEENLQFESVQMLRRIDFDINGHVNNAQYVEIALSAIPDSIYTKLKQQNIEIKYKKECKNRDRMLCKVYYGYDEFCYVIMKDINENTIYAILKTN